MLFPPAKMLALQLLASMALAPLLAPAGARPEKRE